MQEKPRDYFSLENRNEEEEPGAGDIVRTGEMMSDRQQDRKYVLYEDQKGRGWYETMVRGKDGRWIGLEESIFGRRLPEKKKKKRR